MNELLKNVMEAHDKFGRWPGFKKLHATIVTDGALWGMKGLLQDQEPRKATVWLDQQHCTLSPFGDADWHCDFTPARVVIFKSDGTVVAERGNPRESFAGHDKQTPWDPLHLAYFDGYALWTYLSTPFLLMMECVEVSEVDPWNESGETWRVLRACFPKTIATHSAVQDFYFGSDFRLRRHDYRMDLAGGFVSAHLVYNYIEADGIVIPTRRRAYVRGSDLRPISSPVMVSIDVSKVWFS
jgi:hypothetical protein